MLAVVSILRRNGEAALVTCCLFVGHVDASAEQRKLTDALDILGGLSFCLLRNTEETLIL
jgi:hypothetical protein